MSGTLCIRGSSGRMGQELVRMADAEGLPLVHVAEEASVVILAIPSDAVDAALIESLLPRTVIDMSGASKRHGSARYGLLTEDGRLLDGSIPRPGVCYGNPGCMAASVLVGLARAELLGKLTGALHVTAVGGASYAPPGQTGELRLARRLRTHPHVAEIEAAVPGLRVASFAPVVAYGTPRGLLSLMSGQLAGAHAPPDATPAPLDVQEVVGTAKVLHRLEVVDDTFTLAVALDNLVFPAANALALARGLL